MQPQANERPLSVARWTRLTWGGWLLGIPLIIVAALIGEALGVGGAQFFVGLGMGAGVGLMQGRIMRGIIGRVAPWAWATALALALPFLIADLSRFTSRPLPFSLYVAVAAGGLATGIAQARLLRGRLRSEAAWVMASLAGWSLAGGAAALSDLLVKGQQIRGIPGALAYLGVIAAGGLVLGVVTGFSLDRLLRPLMTGS